MDNFLKTVNELQDVFTTVGASPDIMKLPQIVVVGSQSTGKSSVLESILKQNFLPRGSGIVTRRPLIIQIIQDATAETPTASFLHSPDVQYTDFDEVAKEIIRNTDKVCGTSKAISHEPITVKVVSKDLPSLTLVDLPGITKNPVGDQPEDIEKQTTDLVLKYIENPHSIILAVSPGNIDIANSEAIKLAKQVDPTGDRTLAVITKVDLMEKTKENLDVLQGKTLPIKLGIVGVINRNQNQIDKMIAVEESLELEKQYLRNAFDGISDEHGTPYLTQRLCSILMKHIQDCLPELTNRINEEKVHQQAILDTLGPEVTDHTMTLIKLIHAYCNAFSDNMSGNSTTGNSIAGGMSLREVFLKEIEEKLDSICLPQDISRTIETEVRRTSGTRPALFTPNRAFDNLARDIVLRFKAPVKRSIKRCVESIVDIIAALGKDIFVRFPTLKREAHKQAMALLMSKQVEAEDFIDSYLKLEEAYINTNHRLFTISRLKIEEDNKDTDGKELSFESRNIKVIEGLLNLYIDIIRNQLMDIVPKAIMFYVIREFSDILQNNLLLNLATNGKPEELLVENELIESKRKKAQQMVVALQQADVIASMF